MARPKSQNAEPGLQRPDSRWGYSKDTLTKVLAYIRDEAPIVIHVDLVKYVSSFQADTHYRNQFETRTTGGSSDLGKRKAWESRLFPESYDEAQHFDRVKYGVLNAVNDPRGIVSVAKQYGQDYLVLRGARLRTTFSDRDSCTQGQQASCEWYAHVLEKYTDAELQAVTEVALGDRLYVDSTVLDTEKAGEDLLANLHSPVIIDARDPGEVEGKKGGEALEGCIHVPLNMDGMKQSDRPTTKEEFLEKLTAAEALPKDQSQPIITHCGNGGRGGKAAALLRDLGYWNAHNGGSPDRIREARRKPPAAAPLSQPPAVAESSVLAGLHDPVIIDARDSNEVEGLKGGAALEGCLHVPMNIDGKKQTERPTTTEEFFAKLQAAGALPADLGKPIISHCGSGGRGGKTALRQMNGIYGKSDDDSTANGKFVEGSMSAQVEFFQKLVQLVEVQIHGEIEFKKHIEAVVVHPSRRKGKHLEKIEAWCRAINVPLLRMPEYCDGTAFDAPWPHASGSQLVAETPLWRWRPLHSTGPWVRFDVISSSVLEARRRDVSDELPCLPAGNVCNLNLSAMTARVFVDRSEVELSLQRRTAGAGARERASENRSRNHKSFVWEWCASASGHGSWCAYDAERTSSLEKAWCNRLSRLSFSMNGVNYNVDFELMVQVNCETRYRRLVRRRPA
ncbi:unnamed protein product [Symbiodinium sp. CCMP2592]|nr:unnamed protein product [Symbiodinium sp. CCMP2592]